MLRGDGAAAAPRRPRPRRRRSPTPRRWRSASSPPPTAATVRDGDLARGRAPARRDSPLFRTMPLAAHWPSSRTAAPRRAAHIRESCAHCDAVLLILPPVAEAAPIVAWARLGRQHRPRRRRRPPRAGPRPPRRPPAPRRRVDRGGRGHCRGVRPVSETSVSEGPTVVRSGRCRDVGWSAPRPPPDPCGRGRLPVYPHRLDCPAGQGRQKPAVRST